MTTATASRARNSRTLARHQLLFLASLALIALHVIDDSFLQPQPGTSAADHLVSGLVPLTALALAAAAYLRVRAGGRAVIALVAGFFGVVVGIEAVHYTTHGGPSGDDFTGLLAIPAGLALLGLGLQTLWRTPPARHWSGPHVAAARRHRARERRRVRLPARFRSAYAYVGTHAARPPVADIDLGSATVEDVELHTSDGLTLEGSYVPSRNGAAVIVAFGRKGTQPHARYLARHGYGVLIFDRRGEGESDGDPNPYAWNEGERDLDAAIEFLKGRPDVESGRIGGLGLSVGGETFLQAAAHNEDLRCRRLRGRELALGRRAPQRPRGQLAGGRDELGDHAGDGRVLGLRAARRTWSTSSTRSHRGRCSSSTRARAPAARRSAPTVRSTAPPAGPRRSGRSPRPAMSGAWRRARASTSSA